MSRKKPIFSRTTFHCWHVVVVLYFQDDPLSSLPPPGPTARLPAFSETEEPGETLLTPRIKSVISVSLIFLSVFSSTFFSSLSYYDSFIFIISLSSREEEEEDEGRPLQAALQEELHHPAGGRGESRPFMLFLLSDPMSADPSPALWLVEPVGEAGAQLPVSGGPSLLAASPSLLLRLRVPVTLHLHHLRGALLQHKVSVYAQRNQVRAHARRFINVLVL